MVKKTLSLKIIGLAAVVILLFLLLIGYKLNYKKELEKIDKKILNE